MSDPINIPNAEQCRVNHGLITAVPSEDITFGVFRCLGYKLHLKTLQKKQRIAELQNWKSNDRKRKESRNWKRNFRVRV